MPTMKVYPVEGRKIRRPETGVEITEPVDVPDNDSFYIRAVAAGDLTTDKPDEKEPVHPPKKSPESKPKGGDPE